MAIDDNTSYELTGYQVKDLAQKVRAKADSSSLASVATSGLYSDLTGAPTIPTVNNGTLTIQQDGTTVGTFTANQSTNTTVNLTGGGGGSYTAGNGISIDANNEISIDSTVVAEVSDIPTKTSDLQNDGSDGTSTYVEADDLATVATTGSYTDLTNTPSIPAAQVNSDWNASSGVAEILNKPTLATVATSGAYSDLSGTPTIPTVNNATLTITQNGTSAGTFTANSSTDTTIALTDTTYSAMTGASSGAAGTSGLVPAPAAGDEAKVLSGAGTWVAQSGGGPTYTAGNGINISANDEISIDTSVVAELSDLPTVNDGTLTIQHNGTSKGTFTANQSTNATVNIETIYADTVAPATQVAPITTSMIADGAVTTAKLAQAVFDVIYPIGSIIETTSSTNPSSSYGGTWSRINDYQLVAYAHLSGPTTIAVNKNISSVQLTSQANQTYKVTLSKTMANVNYLVFMSCEVAGVGNEIIGIYDKTTTTFLYDLTTNTGSHSAPQTVDISVFGTLSSPEIYKWKRTA